jgi:hypothetical protein
MFTFGAPVPGRALAGAKSRQKYLQATEVQPYGGAPVALREEAEPFALGDYRSPGSAAISPSSVVPLNEDPY